MVRGGGVAAALLGAAFGALAGAGVTWLARSREAGVAPAAADPSLLPPPEPPRPPDAAAPPALAAGQLAPLGDGRRVLWAAPGGDLVVILPEPVSGELEVERVYRPAHEPERHLGEPERRRLHGWYLDEVEPRRRAALDRAAAAWLTRCEAAARLPAEVVQAEEAARAVLRLGGADALAAAIEAPAADAEGAVRRRSATLALAEAGYLLAVPALCELVDALGSTPAGPPLVALLGRLVDAPLPADEPAAAAAAGRRFAAGRPADAPRFERRPGP